jgi:hypothetical protein
VTFVVVSTLVCLVLAALVLAYTAFPHREEPTPGAPWLDSAVGRVRDAVPVIQDGDLEEPATGTDAEGTWGLDPAVPSAQGGAPAARR